MPVLLKVPLDKNTVEAIGIYCDDLRFDHANKYRIGALLSLKDLCSYYESLFFREDVLHFQESSREVRILSFFSHVKNILDQSLMFFISSEVSNSVEQRPLGALQDQLFKEHLYTGSINVNGEKKQLTKPSVYASLNDLKDLFVNRYDTTVGAHLLDFQISIFSAFEYWVSKICNSNNEVNEAIRKSRLNKYKKIIDQYLGDTENQEKYLIRLMKSPGEFIPFMDHFNFILKKKIDKDVYARDIKTDRLIVEFIKATRNTVHNGGIHNGRDISLAFNGNTHTLLNGNALKNEDHNDMINLCGELINIYGSILSSLGEDLSTSDFRILEPISSDSSII